VLALTVLDRHRCIVVVVVVVVVVVDDDGDDDAACANDAWKAPGGRLHM
jgi:hypothetical protein